MTILKLIDMMPIITSDKLRPSYTTRMNRNLNLVSTRMHSSRMRTGRSLTVFRSLQPGGGGTWSRGGVPGPGGCTWSRGGCTWSGGVPGPGGVYLVRGCTWSWGGVPGPGGCTWSWGGVPGPRGVYLVLGGCTWFQGGVYLVRYSPPVNRMTNRCKNITLAKTSFRPVNILNWNR